MTIQASHQDFFLWYNTETGRLTPGYKKDLKIAINQCQNPKSVKILCKTSQNDWAVQVFKEMAEDKQLTTGISADSFGITEEWEVVF